MISFANTPSNQPKPNQPVKLTLNQNRAPRRQARLTDATLREKPRLAKDIRRPLTKKALSLLWYKNVRIDDIAEFFGVSDEKIRTAVAKYDLDTKQQVQEVYDSEWQPGDPTPEEIKQRAAWIRESWTENERLHRMGARVEQAPWTPPAFTYNTKRAMFVGV